MDLIITTARGDVTRLGAGTRFLVAGKTNVTGAGRATRRPSIRA